MGSKNDEPLDYSRAPTKVDFLKICRSLNLIGAEYIVVGGMAIIHHGYLRTTEDIDLLINSSSDNLNRIKKALAFLPDKAIEEVSEDDLNNYSVIRVADEIVIDLMQQTGGINYDKAKSGIVKIKIEDVEIPFAGLELLWKMKQTSREKDKLDLLFIREQLNKTK